MMQRDRKPKHIFYPFGGLQPLCGGRAHIERFVHEATTAGWRVWGPPADLSGRAAGMTPLPSAWPERFRALRNIPVLYARMEDRIDRTRFTRFAVRPWKGLIGKPLVAWECNTVPEYGLLQGYAEEEVRRHIAEMKRAAEDCDVAFCVSEKIAGYVSSALDIQDTVVVPNGSDPDLFAPSIPPVRYLREDGATLRVAWMGGGNIAWHDFGLLRAVADLLWQRGYGTRIRFIVISGRCPEMAAMPPNVVGVGQQPYAELPGWLSGLHVGLCLYRPGPADYCSPLKLYDYMASGLAVLSTPQPQAVSVLREAGLAQAVRRTAEAFVEALIAYENRPETARRHGALLRELLVRRYTWRHAVGRILEAIGKRM